MKAGICAIVLKFRDSSNIAVKLSGKFLSDSPEAFMSSRKLLRRSGLGMGRGAGLFSAGDTS